MPADSPPDALTLWTQAFETWLEAWQSIWLPRRTGDGGPSDPFQLWRRTFDLWLGGWSAGLEQALASPATASVSGRMLDSVLNVEKPLRDQTATLMQFWLEFINMPSRQDVVRLATQLNDANARLDDLQELVESSEDAGFTLEDAVMDVIPAMVRRAQRHSGAQQLDLLGYCMGAPMSMSYVATHPDEPVRNLVMMVGPVDFAHGGFFATWTAKESF